ncbi:MAG: hypothetical protein IT353_07380 [Gemmatimonadaceae bacterium]|nr:hypothetical protein [Gemmatimonadaceae bacterium]
MAEHNNDTPVGSMPEGDDLLLPTWTDDGHLDEGTVHAWLDGAFDATASNVIDAHVSACRHCAEAVAEARGFIAGASRMVRALDVVPSGIVPQEDVARTASRIVAAAAAASPLAARETVRVEVARPAAPRRAWYARAEWRAAAAVLVMVGGGAVVWSRVDSADVVAPVVSVRESLVQDSAMPTEAAATVMAGEPKAVAMTGRGTEGSVDGETDRDAKRSVPLTQAAPATRTPTVARAEDTRTREAQSDVARSVETRADSSSARRTAASPAAPSPAAQSLAAPAPAVPAPATMRTLAEATNEIAARAKSSAAAPPAVPVASPVSAGGAVAGRANEATVSTSVAASRGAPAAARATLDVARETRTPMVCWSLQPAPTADRTAGVGGFPSPNTIRTTALGLNNESMSHWLDWPMRGRETAVLLRRDDGGVYRGTGVAPGAQWTLALTRRGAAWDVVATTSRADDAASVFSQRFVMTEVSDEVCKR